MRITGLITVLFLVGLTACGNLPGAPTVSTKPDQALFERARQAIELEKYDVAWLNLRALINTYPDSTYVKDAEGLLQDSRLRDVAWGTDDESNVMIFFPESGRQK